MPAAVRHALDDLAGLLSAAPERVKVEFQRLGLRAVMEPVAGEGRPHYRANVEINAPLPGLAGIRDLPSVGPASVRSLSGSLLPIFAPNPEQTDGSSTTGRSRPEASL